VLERAEIVPTDQILQGAHTIKFCGYEHGVGNRYCEVSHDYEDWVCGRFPVIVQLVEIVAQFDRFVLKRHAYGGVSDGPKQG
jgi:hypothetical protein